MAETTVKDIITIINAKSPFSAAMDWDNVGLLVGDADWKVRRIHLALDATEEVIDRAIGDGVDLLLTHHPLIFSGMKRITADDFTGRRVIKLISHQVACVAMHTNYDVFGMAQVVARRMGLRDLEVLEQVSVTEHPEFNIHPDGSVTTEPSGGQEEGIGRVGMLSGSESLGEYAVRIRQEFGLSHVRYFGNPQTMVERIAVCPGSGKSEIDLALAKGADVLVTGDIDHHSGLDAVARGLCVIDAGHYGLEHVFLQDEQEYLAGQLGGSVTITQEPFSEPIHLA